MIRDLPPSLSRRLFAEALGTAILVATVIGSGIIAERLAGENQAIALLGNTIAIGAILVVLITILAPISGAHFNPAVTFVFFIQGGHPQREVLPYMITQCLGGICGTMLAHLMFGLAPLVIGITTRTGASQWLSEGVATFMLVLMILGGVRFAPRQVPWLVGSVITAAYCFTASNSFPNPAVTLARGFTTPFSSIAIIDVASFILVQFVSATIGFFVFLALLPSTAPECEHPSDSLLGDRKEAR